MGDIAGRITFIRQRNRERKHRETEAHRQQVSHDNKTNSAWLNGQGSALVTSRAASIDRNTKYLRTDPKLLTILDDSYNTRLNQNKVSWFEKFNRVHFRKFYNESYEFAKPKDYDFSEVSKGKKKYKSLTRHDKLRYLKFFGKLLSFHMV